MTQPASSNGKSRLETAFTFADVLRVGDVVASPRRTDEPLSLTAPLVAERHALPLIGLAQAAVPDNLLDAHALHCARLGASRSPRTQRKLKSLVHQGIAMPLADGLARERAALINTFNSTDFAEGLAAFAEAVAGFHRLIEARS